MSSKGQGLWETELDIGGCSLPFPNLDVSFLVNIATLC